ncbi:cellulose synthase subunit BcsC-related outer membrane protein [Hyphomonas sp.]|jgi:tetratricopeptide (TPR) repeat protein|uniref:cellulose synthase subunit BcsC-related outer membrane protein n=1 Tax=Hyphomonas sp. TaxID=87 RepID=UPI003527A8C7
MMRRSISVPALLTGLGLALQGSANAQTGSGRIEQDPAVRAIGIPGNPDLSGDPEDLQEPPASDIEQVRNLAQSGSAALSSRRLEEMSAGYPGWQVPADLRRRIAVGVKEEKVSDALSRHQWDTVLQTLGGLEAGECEDRRFLRARREALKGQDAAGAFADFYLHTIETCDPQLAAEILTGTGVNLGSEAIAGLLELPVFTQEDELQGSGLIKGLRSELLGELFERQFGDGMLLEAVETARKSRRPDFLNRLAWAFLETDPEQAASLFAAASVEVSNPESGYGLALAYRAAGALPGALRALEEQGDLGEFTADATHLKSQIFLDLAMSAANAADYAAAHEYLGAALLADPGNDKSVAERRGALYLLQAADALDAGEYEQAGQFSVKALDFPGTRVAAEEQLAWARFNSGKAEEAYTLFERLYVETGEDRFADGWVLAAARTGQLARLSRSAPEASYLSRRLVAQRAGIASDRGDYFLAVSLAPGKAPELRGLGNLSVRQSLSMRQQEDGSPDGQFDTATYRTSVSGLIGGQLVEFGVVGLDVSPSSGAGVPYLSSGLFWSPYLSYLKEGDVRVSAEIGITPAGADLAPQPVGHVRVAHRFAETFVEGGIYQQGRRDNALALVGGQQREGARLVGRILETGADLSLRTPVGSNLVLGSNAGVSSLDGAGTLSNSRHDLRISLSRAFRLEGFDYFNTGPFVQYDAYRRNLSAQSASQAGYFSPQIFVQSGWELNFQTDALRQTLYRAGVSIAHQYVEENAPSGLPVSGRTSSASISGAVEFAAGYRLSEHWIATAHMSGLTSGVFDDVQAGISLTFTPGGRRGLVRRDLEPDPFANDLWGR